MKMKLMHFPLTFHDKCQLMSNVVEILCLFRYPKEINSVNEFEKAHPKEEIKNKIPEAININLRPYLSLRYPENITPETAPNKAQLTNQPIPESERLNCDFTSSMVPEITAVSQPNSNPPKVATKVNFNKYFEFLHNRKKFE